MGTKAIFIASTDNYLPYLHVLLNSIEKRCENPKDLDVYILHHEFPVKYFDFTHLFSFNVIPISVDRSSIECPIETKRIEFIKRARFSYIIEYAMKYDSVCLLDADMFIVSPQFFDLFELVRGKRFMVGCNERFKWQIGPNFTANGEPLFTEPTKLYNMHCSVPIIFDMPSWKYVFEYYNRICFNGKQVDKEGNVKGIGDIFCWNIAVQKLARACDMIIFPMEAMTQVHQTNLAPQTFMVVENDYWFTNAGDRVYSIHGRVAQDGWAEGHMERYYRDMGDNAAPGLTAKLEGKVRCGLEAIVDEWHRLESMTFPIGGMVQKK
jgi:hypothetical protein